MNNKIRSFQSNPNYFGFGANLKLIFSSFVKLTFCLALPTENKQ